MAICMWCGWCTNYTVNYYITRVQVSQIVTFQYCSTYNAVWGWIYQFTIRIHVNTDDLGWISHDSQLFSGPQPGPQVRVSRGFYCYVFLPRTCWGYFRGIGHLHGKQARQNLLLIFSMIIYYIINRDWITNHVLILTKTTKKTATTEIKHSGDTSQV